MYDSKIQYLKIEREKADIIKKLFSKKFLIDKRYLILNEGEYILFPLRSDISNETRVLKEIQDKLFMEIVEREGIENIDYKPKDIKEALKNILDSEYFELIPRSLDIIGAKNSTTIAIIEFPERDDLNPEVLYNIKKKIANGILQVNKNVDSIFEKKSERVGVYRTRKLEHLSGIEKTELIHKENNCIFKMDVRKVFFSPRLIFERQRITDSGIIEKDVILDMFAGVGPFSIQIAKHCRAKVICIDINPDAIKYLKENANLNKVEDLIHCFQMDAKSLLLEDNEIIKDYSRKFDRIIMNLPKVSIDFLNVACELVKKRDGVIHFYHIVGDPEPLKIGIEVVEKRITSLGYQINKVLYTKLVKTYSPHKYLTVIDFSIK